MRALLRRLGLVAANLLVITTLTFFLVHLAPGDSAAVRAGVGRGVTAQQVERNRALAGLDRPLGERYLAWLGRSLRLDFGHSLDDGRPVRERLGEALPTTLALSLLALLFAVGVGIPAAVIAAARGAGGARGMALLVALGYGLPPLVTALLLLRCGAPFGASPGALAAAALCLAVPTAASLGRHQHGALDVAMGADYLRTARAVGASTTRILLRHALRNALLPTVTLLGAQLPALLSGSVIVEQIFGLRGLGSLAAAALLGRDYPLLLGLTTVAALFTLGAMLATDLAYPLLDPRLRTDGDGRRREAK